MYSLELATLLHRALEARVGALLDALDVPDWARQPEPLHQVRVASRRARAVLDLVDPKLYPGYARQTAKLRRLTRALGRTRELDVHIALLLGLRPRLARTEALAALEHALEHLDRRRRKAGKAMRQDLAGLSLRKLPALLAVPSLPNPFAAEALAVGVWTCLTPWLERAFAPLAGLLDHEDQPALHDLRIRIKRLRYALEVLGPAFAAEPSAELLQLKGIQRALGEHHDLATLETALGALRLRLAERQRPLLGAGLGELLAVLREERLCAFEQFRAGALGLAAEPFGAGLRRRLAPPEGNPCP